MSSTEFYCHPSAEVSPHALIGKDVQIWHQAQVRERANIGANCIIGKGAYVDFDVQIGANSKIQNGVFIYHGATLEEGVFLGPGVILTNDRLPRAINADGTQKTDDDWQVGPVLIKRGASVGARAVIVPGVTVGEFAMIGAGSVVTKDVAPHALVYGTPALHHGYVCSCGEILIENQPQNNTESDPKSWGCPACNEQFQPSSFNRC